MESSFHSLLHGISRIMSNEDFSGFLLLLLLRKGVNNHPKEEYLVSAKKYSNRRDTSSKRIVKEILKKTHFLI